MKFNETNILGAYLIELNPFQDTRGYFKRIFCKESFEKHDLHHNFAQTNLSYTINKGTIRGLHYQAEPFQETKLITCIKGSIFDVIIDLRPNSPTFKQYVATQLQENTHNTLYIPKGCAHGFQSLENNTVVFYQVDAPHHHDAERGIRWDDPTFQITWPIDLTEISEKDRTYPLWTNTK